MLLEFRPKLWKKWVFFDSGHEEILLKKATRSGNIIEIDVEYMEKY